MSDRDTLIRSLGTITLEAGWINVCGDLGDLLDELIEAGWRPPETHPHVHDWEQIHRYRWCPCGVSEPIERDAGADF